MVYFFWFFVCWLNILTPWWRHSYFDGHSKFLSCPFQVRLCRWYQTTRNGKGVCVQDGVTHTAFSISSLANYQHLQFAFCNKLHYPLYPSRDATNPKKLKNLIRVFGKMLILKEFSTYLKTLCFGCVHLRKGLGHTIACSSNGTPIMLLLWIL